MTHEIDRFYEKSKLFNNHSQQTYHNNMEPITGVFIPLVYNLR